jgi:polysaccharide pyruvyl transferase WcaK-like protein
MVDMNFIRKGLSFGRCLLTDPRAALNHAARKLGYLPTEGIEIDCLLPRRAEGGPRLAHIANYNTANAGDMLLTSVLRDLIMDQCGPARWTALHAHRVVTPEVIAHINRCSGLIVGGGGLFLRDTNPNALSGWQWGCSLEALSRIRVPLVLFAVGYNRFRGQPEFDPIFRDHLIATTEKSVFIGLRNSGSIRAVRGYLPQELHDKVRFQPCMTTLVWRFYPHRMLESEPKTPVVSLNCAFDRAGLRYGDRHQQILSQIAEAMARISRGATVKYYAHSPEDEQILPTLDRRGVHYELVRLYHTTAARMLAAYASPALSIGMRGHSQMIPFGCHRPILSLISHDKLRWFLEDIEAEEWGIEINDPDLADRLSQAALEILDHPIEVRSRIARAQEMLWDTTIENLNIMAGPFGLRVLRLQAARMATA